MITNGAPQRGRDGRIGQLTLAVAAGLLTFLIVRSKVPLRHGARQNQEGEVDPKLDIPQQVEKVNAERLLQLIIPSLSVISNARGGIVVGPVVLIGKHRAVSSADVKRSSLRVRGDIVGRNREQQSRGVNPPNEISKNDNERQDREQDGRFDVLQGTTGLLSNLDSKTGNKKTISNDRVDMNRKTKITNWMRLRMKTIAQKYRNVRIAQAIPTPCSAYTLLGSPLVTVVSVDFCRQIAETQAPPNKTSSRAPQTKMAPAHWITFR